jgi:hypothetical protein
VATVVAATVENAQASALGSAFCAVSHSHRPPRISRCGLRLSQSTAVRRGFSDAYPHLGNVARVRHRLWFGARLNGGWTLDLRMGIQQGIGRLIR